MSCVWILPIVTLAIIGQGRSQEGIGTPPIAEVPREQWQEELNEWQTTALNKPMFLVNTAWFTVKSTTGSGSNLGLYVQNQQCFGCEVQQEAVVSPPGENVTVLIQSDYGNTIQIRDLTADVVLCGSHLDKFRERGDYWLIVYDSMTSQNVSCDLVLANDPPNYNLPVLYAFLVFLGMAVVWIIIKKLYVHGKCQCKNQKSHDLTISTTGLELSNGTINSQNTTAQNNYNIESAKTTAPASPEPPKKKRLGSLDTFRGFSLVIMIFVNYGGGGYWYFQHVHWDGLLVADLVMPWFIWIMGTSISFAFRGMLKRGKSKWRILLKIITRSVKIFAIGLFMGARNTPDMKTLRIPNVLQRLAFTYLITAVVHLICATADATPKWARCCKSRCFWFRDVVCYWPEWMIMLAILALQLALTYALPVPGCPTGYVGPGGLHDGGKYFNCTGGASGYIDRWILTESHIYQWPTIRTLYKTEMAYDPEGILGTLTSIFMCFLGLQAGKIITMYKSHTGRTVRWLIWAILTAAIGTILCQAKQTGGWVPLNKNLWSVSFTLVLSGMAFFLLTLMYLIIDVADFWTGAPFVYPGMNSIVVYVCHSVFGEYFPVSWQWPDYTLHWQQLFRAIWGTVVWVVVAFAMYCKKVFISL